MNPDINDMVAHKAKKEEELAYEQYGHHIATSTDPKLKKILAHNQAEEVEHIKLLGRYLMERTTNMLDSYFKHLTRTKKPLSKWAEERRLRI